MKKGVFLAIQSAICVVFVALLIAGAVGIYREGSARRAEDPLAGIYTAEAVARRGKPALAVGLAGLCLTAVGLALGVRGHERVRHSASRGDGAEGEALARRPGRHLNAVRWAVLAAAVACIVAGVANGTMNDVLAKAISVCSECIGLG